MLWIHFEKDVSNPNCLQGRVPVVFLHVTLENGAGFDNDSHVELAN